MMIIFGFLQLIIIIFGVFGFRDVTDSDIKELHCILLYMYISMQLLWGVYPVIHVHTYATVVGCISFNMCMTQLWCIYPVIHVL